jgi:hypothetical protein
LPKGDPSDVTRARLQAGVVLLRFFPTMGLVQYRPSLVGGTTYDFLFRKQQTDCRVKPLLIFIRRRIGGRAKGSNPAGKHGHQVRLMPAKDVKAYVKRNKNDAADAEAICEAVRRPTMRFVQIKSVEQQGQLMLHAAADPTDQCFASAYGGARHCGCTC